MIDFDKILLAVIAVGALTGLYRGLLKEAVGTFGLLLAAVIANLVSPYGLAYAQGWFSSERIAGIAVWVVTFILAMLVLGWTAHLLGKVLEAASLSWTNRLAGGVFGALKFALFCALAISGIQMVSSVIPALSIQSYVEQSQIVPLLHQVVAVVMPWVSEHILTPALELLKQ